MKRFHIEQSDTKIHIAHAGLTLVGQAAPLPGYLSPLLS